MVRVTDEGRRGRNWEGPPADTTQRDPQVVPFSLPSPQGDHPADTGLTSGGDLPHTFFVSGGAESLSFAGGFGWLGFWACLLQARGFVGSPNDLQNSTCVGERVVTVMPATVPSPRPHYSTREPGLLKKAMVAH